MKMDKQKWINSHIQWKSVKIKINTFAPCVWTNENPYFARSEAQNKHHSPLCVQFHFRECHIVGRCWRESAKAEVLVICGWRQKGGNTSCCFSHILPTDQYFEFQFQKKVDSRKLRHKGDKASLQSSGMIPAPFEKTNPTQGPVPLAFLKHRAKRERNRSIWMQQVVNVILWYLCPIKQDLIPFKSVETFAKNLQKHLCGFSTSCKAIQPPQLQGWPRLMAQASQISCFSCNFSKPNLLLLVPFLLCKRKHSYFSSHTNNIVTLTFAKKKNKQTNKKKFCNFSISSLELPNSGANTLKWNCPHSGSLSNPLYRSINISGDSDVELFQWKGCHTNTWDGTPCINIGMSSDRWVDIYSFPGCKWVKGDAFWCWPTFMLATWVGFTYQCFMVVFPSIDLKVFFLANFQTCTSENFKRKVLLPAIHFKALHQMIV